MYGSIFRMRIKPAREEDAVALFDEWWRARGPRVPGVIASYLLRPDRETNEALGVAIFADRASYHANASDPDQDQWYRRLRDTLEDEPQWEDGEFIRAEVSPLAAT